MAGLCITDLPVPSDRYRVDKRTERADGVIDVESDAACRFQDRLRSKEISASVPKFTDPGERLRALRLARRLEVQVGTIRSLPCAIGASRLWMLAQRINICGALWELVAQLKPKQFVAFTVAIPQWSVRSEDLAHFDPTRMLRSFRTDLWRAGAANSSGWLYAAIHGEFDRTTGRFQLHLHGIATRGMIGVVKALRQLGQREKYNSKRDGIGADAEDYVALKLRIDRKLYDLPRPITYTTKSFWTADASYVDCDGVRRRYGHKSQITGIHQTRYLLWLDRHPLKHLTLLVHLRVTRQGLTPTR
jgi:hypothetical protein